MKKILFIQNSGPYSSLRSQEGLDMLLLASSFTFQITLLFMGDAVWQLSKNQQAELLARKNMGLMIKSLPAFDIISIFAEAQALEERNLTVSDLVLTVTPITHHDISAVMRRHDLIINF